MECIVSAIYEVDPYIRDDKGLEPSLTRNMTCDHYAGGIYSLAAFDKPIVLFVNDRNIGWKGRSISIKDLLDDIISDKEFLKTINFVPFKLQNFYSRYDTHWVQSTKVVDNNPGGLFCWNPAMACVRMDFFDHIFKNMNYSKAIWFDAALSNESYVSEKFGGTWHDWELINWDNYYPKNKDAIFCPDFYNNISNLVDQHGNLICGNGFLNLEPRMFIRELLKNKDVKDKCFTYFSSTGAFMGFTKDYFYDRFYNEWLKSLDLFIDSYDRVFTEIEVLSYMNMYMDFAKIVWQHFSSMEDVMEGSMQEAFLDIKNNTKEVLFNNYLSHEELTNPPGDYE
jgi:hypothetical protein